MQSANEARVVSGFIKDGRDVAIEVTGNPDLSKTRREQLEAEYERLWAEFGASVGRLASSYESRAHAREDLLQDIRLAIWTALPRFRGDASLRTFVFRIAHNRALTHVWQRKKAGQPEESEEVVDERENPEASAIQTANRLRLVEAIRGLPIPFRQVLTLALEDLTHAEIAAVLGISENNVAVRMNRARNLLKEILGSRR
ncbi:MAG: sigma-70 family RNA polymerase sigma factor [Terriglobales bacterium]|jgi:RNA polymerase sigma-70 factor (ECF subfamily)